MFEESGPVNNVGTEGPLEDGNLMSLDIKMRGFLPEQRPVRIREVGETQKEGPFAKKKKQTGEKRGSTAPRISK